MDTPSSDDRYRRRRLDDFERILGAAGLRASRRALEAGYDASAMYLRRVWRDHRDVPAESHLSAILAGAEPGLPRRVARWVMTELIDAPAAVHVGDDAVLDVGGARAAGMRAIHVRSTPGPASAADAAIASRRDLPAAVAALDGA
jgi:phosphoglycolate phosphatase-like HAD superfamily hydrolase